LGQPQWRLGDSSLHRFDRAAECDGQTDRQTDGQTDNRLGHS